MARTRSENGGGDLDGTARALIKEGRTVAAVEQVLKSLGPEVHGFLCASLGNDGDADEVFSAVAERLWRSLGAFEWRCTLRTWLYVIARREAERFVRAARRHRVGRVRLSELVDVIAAARTESQAKRRSEQRNRFQRLRDELEPADRDLIILRVDRGLAWDEIALAFVDDPDSSSAEDLHREAARVRKRFQLVKEGLARRVREEGLSLD